LWVLLIPSPAFAVSAALEAPAQVTIPATFSLALSHNAINFGSMRPGAFSGSKPKNVQFGFEQGLIITATSNNGLPWQITMNTTGPLQSGADTIASTAFQAFGWVVAGEATGTFLRGTAAAVSTIPEVIYTSSAAEGVNTPSGSKVHMQFQIAVPDNTIPGTYVTTLRFTMTE
jgi:hypothetical protein